MAVEVGKNGLAVEEGGGEWCGCGRGEGVDMHLLLHSLSFFFPSCIHFMFLFIFLIFAELDPHMSTQHSVKKKLTELKQKI